MFGLAVSACVALPHNLLAQTQAGVERDTLGALVANELKSKRRSDFAVAILRQQFGFASAATRDSVADLIVAFVVNGATDSLLVEDVSRAIDLLGTAASPPGGGTPYANGVSKLTRIARDAGGNAGSQAAIVIGSAFTEEEAADSLLALAALPTRIGYAATRTLTEGRKPKFRERLITLCRQGPLPNAYAEAQLQSAALRDSLNVGRCGRQSPLSPPA